MVKNGGVMQTAEDRIATLPIWQGPIDIAPLAGGITNKNFVVRDGGRRVVVRVGADIPQHGIMRFNEVAASTAAAACGISPAVVYAAPGILAIAFIDGHTLTTDDVRAQPARLGALIRRVHSEMPKQLRGPLLAFHVFHIIRDYAHSLRDGGSPFAADLPRLLTAASAIEAALRPTPIVFAHNDLLAANFIDDGKRLWLIDWDYAGFNTPFFDLANLAANNVFDAAQQQDVLAGYFGATATPQQWGDMALMRAASALREAMWAMVQALRPTIDFDYITYAQTNLAVFDTDFARVQEHL